MSTKVTHVVAGGFCVVCGDTEEWLRERYIVERHTIPELAAEVGVTMTTINRHLEAAGVRHDDLLVCVVEVGFEDWYAGTDPAELGGAAR